MGTTPFIVPDYNLSNIIGDGHAGTVYHANPKDKSNQQNQVAIKIIPRSKVRDSVRREVGLHLTLHHPNITKLYRVSHAYPSSYSTNQIRSSSPCSLNSLAMVMELAPKGDMFSEVLDHGGLPSRLLRSRIRDICNALQYLHQNRIVHHDIKLENVVIFNSSTAKLIDFGCARYMDPEEPLDIEHLGGTLQYLPPEVVANKTIRSSPSLDAWALGVLIYTALVGCYPFNAAKPNATDTQNDLATRHRITNSTPHSIPSSIQIPQDLKFIMNGLLQKDPEKRMTISTVLSTLDNSTIQSSFFVKQSIQKALIEPVGTHASCPGRRPRSPISPQEAQFDTCDCDSIQTLENALKTVDLIQRNSLRAAEQVQKFMSDLEKSATDNTKHDFENNIDQEVQLQQTSADF